jgi:uncharacterized protein YraI
MVRNLTLVIVVILLTSCSAVAPDSPLPTMTKLTQAATVAVPTTTQTSAPSPSPTLAPSATATVAPSPTPTLTPTPFIPFMAAVWADNVNARTSPGYLFPVIQNVAQGTEFLVLGRSPGGEWIQIESATGWKGWVFAKLVDSEADLQFTPVIQPSSVQLVRGHVQDEQGNPISGIQFALTQGNQQNEQRTDAMTDDDGYFYAFMPPSATGSWAVLYTAIACTSNTMDSSCSCLGGICGDPSPLSITITLPQTEPLVFTWQ